MMNVAILIPALFIDHLFYYNVNNIHEGKNLQRSGFENSPNNVRILQVRLLKELCSRHYNSKQSGDMPIFDIQDIYTKSFKDIEEKQF